MLYSDGFDFNDRQSFSNVYSPDLNTFYFNIWDIDTIEVVNDKERQMQGIDKILHTVNGEDINIDEKIESIKRTDNIVFEAYTNIDTGNQGWLKAGQKTDYVVDYQIFMKKVYIMPFQLMLQELNEKRQEWDRRNLSRIIYNKKYRGQIYIVPKTEVFEYISQQIPLKWEEFEYNFPQ